MNNDKSGSKLLKDLPSITIKQFAYNCEQNRFNAGGLEIEYVIQDSPQEPIFTVFLSYTFGGDLCWQYLNLVQTPSNLNKGLIKHFQCPITDSLVRRLYLDPVDKKWKSREALKGRFFYLAQILGKKDRDIVRLASKVGQLQKLLNSKKYFTQKYGKETTRSIRIRKLVEAIDTIQEHIT